MINDTERDGGMELRAIYEHYGIGCKKCHCQLTVLAEKFYCKTCDRWTNIQGDEVKGNE